MVTRPKMPCGRREGKACDRSVPGKSHVLEVLSNRLSVSQVVVLLYEAVENLFQGASSHLPNRDGEKLSQRLFDGALVYFHSFRRTSVQEGIFRWNLFHRGKTNCAFALQIQKESPADHVLGLSVWLGPVPRDAQPPRQGTTPLFRMIGDHLPDKSNVCGCKSSVSEGECIFHA